MSAKTWSTSALSAGKAPLVLFVGAEPAAVATAANRVSPVEYLLLAVASCLALSCRAILAARQFDFGEFRIDVVGEKAPAMPSRLDRITATVGFSGHLPQPVAESIVRDAEALCTVSNTLLGTPSVAVVAHCARAQAPPQVPSAGA